jgi:hypothetical protein
MDNEKIAEAIRRQISAALGAEISPGFVTIRDPAGFPYSIQYGDAAYWNPNTLGLLDQTCRMVGAGAAEMTGASFSALYADVLANSGYVMGSTDQAREAQDQSSFTKVSAKLVGAFETELGAITEAQIRAMGSTPPTKTQYISDYVAKTFPGDPPDFPPSLAGLANLYSDWLDLARGILHTVELKERARALLTAARAHAGAPDEHNGGMQTGADTWRPGYAGLPDNGTLQAQLSDTSRAITVGVVLDKDADTASLMVNHVAQGVIQRSDVRLAVTEPLSEREISLDRIWQTAIRVEMDIRYPGLAIVGALPCALATDYAKGWYSETALAQIAGKTGTEETGIKLVNSTYSVPELFGAKGRLVRVKTFVISQEPTITLRFYGVDQEPTLAQFSGDLEASIEIGTVAQFGGGTSGSKVQSAEARGGVVTVVIAPAQSSVTVPPIDRRAHIIGGVVQYPPE